MSKTLTMVNYSCSLILLLILSAASGKVSGGCFYLSTIGGGCPNKYECLETCRPCFRGIGTVKAGCVGPSGPTPYWECRCYFQNGAPCPPAAPPRCPRIWPPTPFFSSVNQNHTLLHS